MSIDDKLDYNYQYLSILTNNMLILAKIYKYVSPPGIEPGSRT